MSWKASVLAVALAAAIVPSFAHAQNNDNGGGNGGGGGGQRQRGQGGPGGGGGGPGGGFGGGNMTERIKEQLKVQDDEWRVIEPKLTKVVDAQRSARGNMFGGMGGRRGQGGGGGGQGGPGGGGPGGGGNQPQTPVSIAQGELRTAIESDASSPEDIDKKLAAYRAARADAQAKLDAARKDLKEVLTPKQEAQLVLFGILE